MVLTPPSNLELAPDAPTSSTTSDTHSLDGLGVIARELFYCVDWKYDQLLHLRVFEQLSSANMATFLNPI